MRPNRNGASKLGIGLAEIECGNSKGEARYRREICAAGRRLRELGLLPAAAGNLSVRLADGRILVTPSGRPKGELEPEELILLRADGKRPHNGAYGAAAGGRVSSELRMHLRVYALRPDVRAVCHAHPPIATGYAAAGKALDRAVIGETAILLGAVPLAAYGAPGTDALPDSIAPYVPHVNAILLANHGAVTFGEDLRTAMDRMELVEHLARVSFVADQLGGPKLLTRSDVALLESSRSRYGVSPLSPGAPRLRTTEDET
jgi:L-fuculose-phosphate aldolase